MAEMRGPNVLWICTDQQRFDTLGATGNSFVHTPNLDGLAASGVLCTHCFCQNPVCTPSRASFLTGRYPRTTRCRQNGQAIPADEVPVTRVLAEAGYHCGLVGKLHISPVAPKVTPVIERRIADGYGEFHWSHHPAADWPANEYTRWLDGRGTQFHSTPVEGCRYIRRGMPIQDHQTTWCGDVAAGFIRGAARFNRPWLLSVNPFDPHHPFDPPPELLDQYLAGIDRIPLPNYVQGELANKPVFQQRDHRGAYNRPGSFACSEMSPKDHRHIRAAYWAMIDLIDRAVGRMLDALAETGQLERTIVIFMSDHGELLGDHGLYLKGPHFYDPAVRVPLILSWPGRVAPTVMSSLVELVDLAPTLLDACGLPRSPGMQGRSLWPLLIGQDQQVREDVYCEFYNAGTHPDAQATMVRTASAKLVAYHGQGTGELYDLTVDANESHNLWAQGTAAALKEQMLSKLCDRMAWTVDPLPLRQSGF